MIHYDALTNRAWRKSSFSGGGDASGANCVEAAWLADGRFAIRDSKNPSGGVLLVARAWIEEIKAGS